MIILFKKNLKIEFKTISKLSHRLEDAAPFTDPLEDVAFEYGFNSKRLQEIITYWKKTYLPKWSQRQTFLNQYPQFKTQIQGLDIHFLHVKPKVKKDTKVFPLLVGTFFETRFRYHRNFLLSS